MEKETQKKNQPKVEKTEDKKPLKKDTSLSSSSEKKQAEPKAKKSTLVVEKGKKNK